MNTTTTTPGSPGAAATAPRRRRNGICRMLALLIAVIAGVSLAACSGPAGAKSANVDTPRLKIAMVTSAAPGDTFWDIVRKGGDTAASKDNVELLYSSDPDGSRQAQLVQQAVDQKVDGIVVALSKPDAVGGAVKEAVAAGIPVVSINAGENQFVDLGISAHFGQNETLAGESAGKQLNEVGAKKVLCIVHEQGQIALEQRCEGVKSTFTGQVEQIYVNIADMASSASTITSKLQTTTDIDYVMALAAPIAMSTLDSVQSAGSSAKVATFDMSADAITALQDGRLAFIVDQQPYLQGYLSVENIWLQKTNGNTIGGGKPVYTGPNILTKDDADAVAEFAKNGTR